jgi:hypothetical protein
MLEIGVAVLVVALCFTPMLWLSWPERRKP